MNHIVSAWGDNSNGQLGNGDTSIGTRNEPGPVPGIDGVVSKVEAGSGHVVALLDDGTVYAWGRNAFGQIGDGTSGNAEVPSKVHVDGVKDIAPGGGHTLLLREDGTVWGCGAGFFGMLGPEHLRVHPEPVQVPLDLPGEIVQVASGGSQGLALLADGTVWSWGRDDVGQLGDGEEWGKREGTIYQAHAGREYPVRPVAKQVLGLEDIVYVAAGGGHSLAVTADGSLYAFGTNDCGHCGDGTTQQLNSPTKANVSGVRQVAGAYHHTVALLDDGTLVAFGKNDQGQLGNGSTVDSLEPVEVLGPRDVTQVACIGGGGEENPGGFGHNLALTADGTVWAWGCNGHGELGTGDTENRPTPVRLGLSGVRDITVGGEVPGFRENPGGGYAVAVHAS